MARAKVGYNKQVALYNHRPNMDLHRDGDRDGVARTGTLNQLAGTSKVLKTGEGDG